MKNVGSRALNAFLWTLALVVAAAVSLSVNAQTPASRAAPSTAVPPPAPSASPAATDPLVVRGEYLARAGDCISCHSRPNGIPYAGGLAMKTPFGTIFSTNITPDKEQGIGNYTLDDFKRALREGKAPRGHLYPAMPYTNFSRLTDADVQALYSYFLNGVAPQKQDNEKTDLPWPFSMRWLMAGWNAIYLPGKIYEPEPAQSAEWNRGAYLVQGLGHCSACHTPRSITGAEKASTEKGGDVFLSGAIIDGWYAQPLRNTVQPGLGSWTPQDIADYLKAGRNAHTAAFGAMVDVVANSTQHMSREDLGAIAVYLKSLGGESATPGTVAARAPMGSDPTTAALRAGRVDQRGALVYLNNCASCHRSDGEGYQRTFPTLSHNSAVAAKDPTSLIRIVLAGSSMAHTGEAPSELGMPGFGWRLTDANVADVLSLVRSSWGNRAAEVTPDDVRKVRSVLEKPGAVTQSRKP